MSALDSFPKFAQLPYETQNHVWYLAVPDPSFDEPALFFYSEGLIEWYVAGPGELGDGHGMFVRFYHERLDAVPVHLPLLQATRRAREVCLQAAAGAGYTVKERDNGCKIMARPMDADKDFLYYDHDMIEAEAEETWELIVDGPVHGDFPTPGSFVISEDYALAEDGYISAKFDEAPDLNTMHSLYIVAGPDPTPEERERRGTGGVQASRLEIDTEGYRAWVFDPDTKQWQWGPGDMLGSEELNLEIEKCTVDMTDKAKFGQSNQHIIQVVKWKR